jgi:hypothetical protein
MKLAVGETLPSPEMVEKELGIAVKQSLCETLAYISATPSEHLNSEKFSFPGYLRSLPKAKDVFNAALNRFDPENYYAVLRTLNLPISSVKADNSLILYIMRMHIFIGGCEEVKIIKGWDAYRIPYYLSYLTARAVNIQKQAAVQNLAKNKQQPKTKRPAPETKQQHPERDQSKNET